MLHLTEKDKQRFWSKVDIKTKDECWEWQASCMNSGYGQFFIRWKPKVISFSSHRLSYILTFGNIPDGLCVCHHCDNKKCANPNHLFLGTHKDNLADRDRKGRRNRGDVHGERNGRAKLTWKLVRKIREIQNPNISHIAKIYGVARPSIVRILNNTGWIE